MSFRDVESPCDIVCAMSTPGSGYLFYRLRVHTQITGREVHTWLCMGKPCQNMQHCGGFNGGPMCHSTGGFLETKLPWGISTGEGIHIAWSCLRTTGWCLVSGVWYRVI